MKMICPNKECPVICGHRVEHELTDRWIPLEELREGAIFETKDRIQAVKSEYRYSNENLDCECILLASGEYAHFPNHNQELVREIQLTKTLSSLDTKENREKIAETVWEWMPHEIPFRELTNKRVRAEYIELAQQILDLLKGE